ncbi:hypothetical protein [Kribbella sp. NPDC051718]|uniref:hypothetical protein n=1 Tax=Kribbella sp. NPDC051718 TaxID=3155168 RepID=UPI0034492B27
MRILKTASLAAAAAILCLVGAGQASAAPVSEQPSAGSVEGPFARFALTAAQAKSLQAQVDEQLAATSGGKQISQNEVAYDGGDTIMTFSIPGRTGTPPSSKVAAPDAVADVRGCPTGTFKDWSCVYEFSNFNENTNGRRLQFHDCGGRDFDTYNFRDKTSSWVNTQSKEVHVSNFTTSGSLVLLWKEPAQSQSSSVTPANDNKADYLDVRC